MFFNCKYCGITIQPNKQGIWGWACSSCKSTLTKRLRSGKYTKQQLLNAKYNWEKSEWMMN